MKKAFSVLIAATIVAGGVWGQTVNKPPATPNFDAASNLKSVDKVYSSSRFANDIDNFIDVNNYTGLKLDGTFFVLGWANSSEQTGFQSSAQYPLSIGFAQTFSFGYVAAYFSGNIVGDKNYTIPYALTSKTAKSTNTSSNNNLVLFFGNEGIGGIRFDLITKGNSASWDQSREEGKIDGHKGSYNDPFVTTLKWGKNIPVGENTLKPNVTLGFQWPSLYQDSSTAKAASSKESTGEEWGDSADSTKDAYIFVKAAADYALADGKGTLAADVSFINDFGYTGKTDNGTIKTENSGYGQLWLPVNIAYKNTINADKLSIGYKANLLLQFYSVNNSSKTTIGSTTVDTDTGAETSFEIKPSVDLGLKYAVNEKFALFTGAKLTIIDFVGWGKADGDSSHKDQKTTSSALSGLTFDTTSSATGADNLGLGASITIVENLNLGVGLNWLTDNFIKIDLKNMNVTLFDDIGDFDLIQPLQWLGTPTLNITLSYKTGSN